MATRLLEYVKKATFTTGDLQGAGNGGYLSPEQAKTFLRDAIEATVILQDADVFDSQNPVFEVPKISFSQRIMRAGTEGTRLADTDRQVPDTDLVTLTTKMFKGEVPISDETFEDNVERDGLADSIMQMIAEAVGRDLEQIAIQSNTADATADFNQFDGLIQSLVKSGTANKHDATNDASYKAMFKAMVKALPTRYRRNWNSLRLYVTVATADGYADELGERGTQLGDSNVDGKQVNRYRGIPVVEVPLLAGTENAVDYSKFAILCDPKNLKVGFHRRVRVEQFRDPREGALSFIPSVRYDLAWAQDTAVVLGQNVPDLTA